MKGTKRSLIFAVITLLLALPAFAGQMGEIGMADVFSPAEPRLLYPITEKISLAGKDNLEFRWELRCDFADDGYEFRLYKGYNWTATNLLVKERLPASAGSFSVKADLFADGEVYTWTLRRVTLQGGKSDRAFNSFKTAKQ